MIFGVTFEADGYRGKTITVIVREEIEHTTGYCPMFGDFIVLKDGNLVFQFRNIKGGKRLNLQYKIEKHTFPPYFVNKYLPDYHAEERFIQSNTLNIGYLDTMYLYIYSNILALILIYKYIYNYYI